MTPAELKLMLSQAYTAYVKHYQFIGLIVIISLIIGYISVLALGNDNPMEEAAEDVIKEETGISLELTPDSKPK
jgi:hypothetical protein